MVDLDYKILEVLEEMGIYCTKPRGEDTTKDFVERAIYTYKREISRIKSDKCILTEDEKERAIANLKMGIKTASKIKKGEGIALIAPAYFYTDMATTDIYERVDARLPRYFDHFRDRVVKVLADSFQNQSLSVSLADRLQEVFKNYNITYDKLDSIKDSVREREVDINSHNFNPLREDIFGSDSLIGKLEPVKKSLAISSVMAKLSHDHQEMCESAATQVSIYWKGLSFIEFEEGGAHPPLDLTTMAPDYVKKLDPIYKSQRAIPIPFGVMQARLSALHKAFRESAYESLVQELNLKKGVGVTREQEGLLYDLVDKFLAGETDNLQAVKKAKTFEELSTNALLELYKNPDFMRAKKQYLDSVETFESANENIKNDYKKSRIYGTYHLYELGVTKKEEEFKKAVKQFTDLFSKRYSHEMIIAAVNEFFETGGKDYSIINEMRKKYSVYDDEFAVFFRAEEAFKNYQKLLDKKDKASADLYALEHERSRDNRTPEEERSFMGARKHLIERGFIELDDNEITTKDDSLALELAEKGKVSKKDKQATEEDGNIDSYDETQTNGAEEAPPMFFVDHSEIVEDLGNGLFATQLGNIVDENGTCYIQDASGNFVTIEEFTMNIASNEVLPEEAEGIADPATAGTGTSSDEEITDGSGEEQVV